MSSTVRWIFICTLAVEATARAVAVFASQDHDPTTPYQVLTASNIYSVALTAAAILTLLALPRRPRWSAVCGIVGGVVGFTLTFATGVALIYGAAVQGSALWVTAPALLALAVAHLVRVWQCGSRLNPRTPDAGE